jgi:hypothetical protein
MAEQSRRAGLQIFRAAEARPFDEALASKVFGYILSGEAHLGSQVLRAGDGFFAPGGAPYTYTAGSEGVEVLEFRATSTVELRYLETPERWERLIELANESRERWTAESAPHR